MNTDSQKERNMSIFQNPHDPAVLARIAELPRDDQPHALQLLAQYMRLSQEWNTDDGLLTTECLRLIELAETLADAGILADAPTREAAQKWLNETDQSGAGNIKIVERRYQEPFTETRQIRLGAESA